MTLTIVLAVAAALFAIGLAGAAARRSHLGALVGFELMIGAAALAAVALTLLAGRDSTLGQVIAVILIGVGAAAAVVLLALHIAASRPP